MKEREVRKRKEMLERTAERILAKRQARAERGMRKWQRAAGMKMMIDPRLMNLMAEEGAGMERSRLRRRRRAGKMRRAYMKAGECARHNSRKMLMEARALPERGKMRKMNMAEAVGRAGGKMQEKMHSPHRPPALVWKSPFPSRSRSNR